MSDAATATGSERATPQNARRWLTPRRITAILSHG